MKKGLVKRLLCITIAASMLTSNVTILSATEKIERTAMYDGKEIMVMVSGDIVILPDGEEITLADFELVGEFLDEPPIAEPSEPKPPVKDPSKPEVPETDPSKPVKPETGPSEPDEEVPPTEEPSEPGEEVPPIEEPSESVPPIEEPSEPEAEVPPAEEETTEWKNVFSLNAPVEKYSYEAYIPSSRLLFHGDKVKYNVALPIEGIPSFITQEMIIGALKCQDETGFPASVTIAQIIQESGFGNYGPSEEEGKGLSYLAYQYGNLFGIKGEGPAGSVNMLTGEQTTSGENYTIHAGFRAYNTYTEAIQDRSELLQEVYSDLTVGSTDANTFAMKIGSRWATDISYGRHLIQQMETYDLYRLDELTVSEFGDLIGKFANPCPGATVSSTFGYRDFDSSNHKGFDLATGEVNIPTYAAEAGVVKTAGFSSSAGNWVVIDHGNGLLTKYMHHIEIFVKEGQTVGKGQQIGLSGTTGDSTGNHLHFQVEENGAAVDPAPYLKAEVDQQTKDKIEAKLKTKGDSVVKR